ncbi:hypothetical protein Nmel_018353 [Mimus melanotis]
MGSWRLGQEPYKEQQEILFQGIKQKAPPSPASVYASLLPAFFSHDQMLQSPIMRIPTSVEMSTKGRSQFGREREGASDSPGSQVEGSKTTPCLKILGTLPKTYIRPAPLAGETPPSTIASGDAGDVKAPRVDGHSITAEDAANSS